MYIYEHVCAHAYMNLYALFTFVYIYIYILYTYIHVIWYDMI